MRNLGVIDCPVCLSKFTTHLREFAGTKSFEQVPLYFCLNCGSAITPSNFEEDDDYIDVSARWHLKVEDRNIEWARLFLEYLTKTYPHVRSIVEIGCGTGTLLNVAQSEFGLRARGYDSNSLAIELGRERYNGLDLRDELFETDFVLEQFDLVVCMSVLEHQIEPRYLAGQISDYCKRTGSIAFLSVPYFAKSQWHYLLEADDSTSENSPFKLVDFHLIHFSIEGFESMLRSLGATNLELVFAGWRGHFVSFSSDEANASCIPSVQRVSAEKAKKSLREKVRFLKKQNRTLENALAQIHRSRWVRLGSRLGLSKITIDRNK